MIESISISGVATYDDSGVKIDNLKKVNFIYGANGTGKTTITRLLGNNEAPEFSKSSVTWKDDSPLPTLVYNRDFRNENFGKGKMAGVFTLGKATKEEKEAINQMDESLNEIKSNRDAKKESHSKCEIEEENVTNTFHEAAWKDVFKKYEDIFKDAFKGFMKSKKNFVKKLLSEFDSNNLTLKSLEELKEEASTIFGTAPSSLDLIAEIDYARILELEADPIWQKKIIGKSDINVAKLIQTLGINDWVHQGRNHIRDDGICPFCQEETITKSFRSELDSYFDKRFEEDAQQVKNLTKKYTEASKKLIESLEEIERKEKSNTDSKLNLELFSAKLKIVIAQLQANDRLVEGKGEELSRSIKLTSLKEQFEGIDKLIKSANDELKKHNKIVDNYGIEKDKFIDLVWKFLVEEYRIEINQYRSDIRNKKKQINTISDEISKFDKEYTKLNKGIEEANKKVTSVQPSIDEINKTLKSFGFLNFEIVRSNEDKNQYQIQRENGSNAESTLSEGEITFITFLYFLQIAKGGLTEDSVSNEKVLVIDDPISSLDSNVMFVVSHLIKRILENVRTSKDTIRQVLLLTHNVYFHKEMSYVKSKKAETSFWILKKRKHVSEIESHSNENPILNSYELLWRELQNLDNNDGATIQNTMRRIIEYYFKILGGYDDKDLIDKFSSSHEDQIICRSLLSWMHAGSHGIPDDLFIQTKDDNRKKYYKVFKQIFKNMGHDKHFEMMESSSDERN